MMASPQVVSTPTPAQRVLLFGSQALSIDGEHFHKLSQAVNEENHRWCLDALLSLSEAWPNVVRCNPKLRDADGERRLMDLHTALSTGEIPESFFPLPNSLLTPLTVITHLVQYSTLLTASLPCLNAGDKIPLSTTSSTEVLGLCTGMLSAFAVGCASSIDELRQFGAVAIRLGFLIGALVDVEECLPLSDGRAMSFSVSWTSADSSSIMGSVLENFPQVRRLASVRVI